MQLERDVNEVIAQRLQGVHATFHRAPKPVEVVLASKMGCVHDSHLDGVHVNVGSLAVQEHRVPATKPFQDSTSRARRTVLLSFNQFRASSLGTSAEVGDS